MRQQELETLTKTAHLMFCHSQHIQICCSTNFSDEDRLPCVFTKIKCTLKVLSTFAICSHVCK